MSKEFLFTRIGYNYLPTTDIDGSISWYTENLGLKLHTKFEERGSFIAALHYPHKNAIAIVLIETRDCKPLRLVRNGEEFPVMAMNCTNIDNTYQHLKGKGVEVGDINVLGEGTAKYFYFKDDQGNLLEAAWSKWDPVDDIKEDFT